MTQFEIVDYVPTKTYKSKFQQAHLELMQIMLKVPRGKSIRRGHPTGKDAMSYANSLHTFIKKQKLKETYFVSARKEADPDGKFYVYIGKKYE